jgi:hypothetical protein
MAKAIANRSFRRFDGADLSTAAAGLAAADAAGTVVLSSGMTDGLNVAVLDAAGNVIASEAPVRAASTFGAQVRGVVTNKYVLGGLAAVAVAGAAYGTYRVIKNRSAKKAAGAASSAMTAEQKVDSAREMLKQAEAELAAATGAPTKAVKAAVAA